MIKGYGLRKSPLTREEKEKAERLLRDLDIHPGMACQIVFHLDSNGKIASTELVRMVWR